MSELRTAQGLTLDGLSSSSMTVRSSTPFATVDGEEHGGRAVCVTSLRRGGFLGEGEQANGVGNGQRNQGRDKSHAMPGIRTQLTGFRP
ncbi:hypothetical protein [Streptomyces albipurpureus]|uniref:Uncharacterized protein n=1 Tax=Streptomyces albipurpureus TaxID=2897419 RepID=A0ABT0UZU6_9ACTN|nr:hypothetical protein [Streptomyces sp. CWNU-1]MCM2393947.1 hypothetical protein [Streptomyces sp. CWNU-1]